MKERADRVVMSLGLAESCQKAQALIMAGRVFADGSLVEKPGQKLDPEQDILLKEGMRYVSRGGLKLEEALQRFHVEVKQKKVADLGASTGGFADCLLQHGAGEVFAVDVDTRQFDWQLSKDPRVFLIRKNARYLEKKDFQDEVDMVTMDLSFISVIKVFPAVKRFLAQGCILCLVKPQFEVGKGQVGNKGIVKDPGLHQGVLLQVIEGASELGFHFQDVLRPSVRGQKGNQEYFIHLGNSKKMGSLQMRALIKEAIWNEKD